MAMTRDQRIAEQRASLLAALDAEDQRLLSVLEEEAQLPTIPPYRYDLRHRLPIPRRP